jgi:hypothetical protein
MEKQHKLQQKLYQLIVNNENDPNEVRNVFKNDFQTAQYDVLGTPCQTFQVIFDAGSPIYGYQI